MQNNQLLKTSNYLYILLINLMSLNADAADVKPNQVAPSVHEYHLDNGLKILVKEDHRAPVVVAQIWYKVGSSYELLGNTGISHMLEHMMFKGTPAYPSGELSRIIAANGGSENAFTGRDYTAYFQSLENTRLEISFKLEADRMRNLLLPAAEFVKEQQVVMEERRLRTEDNPRALTQEQLMATALVNSSYRWPIIGWMGDIANLNIDDMRDWYKRWYAPNNATVVVVGDIKPDAVFNLAKQYFAELTPEKTTPAKRQVEPQQRGERRVIVKAPARLPYLMMSYPTPVLNNAHRDWEPYALEVLAQLLDGDNSARFARELVRDSAVAATAGASYSAYSRLSDMFTIDGIPAQGKDLKELETALRAQVQRARDELASSAELARVKVQVVAENIYQKDSVFYQAMELGILETVGLDWRIADQYVERIQAITAEQVRDVARKYLQDDSLNIAILDPQPINAKKANSATITGDHHVH